MAKLTKKQAAEREEAIKTLREIFPPGSTAYTDLKHCSSSGMSRHITVHAVKDGDIRDVTYLVAKVIKERINERTGGLVIGGTGMDMGFHVVYTMSSYLYRDGFTCTGKQGHPDQCPSNDHNNGDSDYTPHHHGSGGYAIRQRWI